MILPEEDIRIFNDSLDRLIAHPGSLERFYERFIGGSERVAKLFEGTDFERQKRALKASLYTAMLAADNNQPAIDQLQQLAQSHHEMGVEAEHYDFWLNCLLATVRECAGSLDARTERAWRSVLAVAISIMRDEVGAGAPDSASDDSDNLRKPR